MKEPFDNKNKFKKKKPLGSETPSTPPPMVQKLSYHCLPTMVSPIMVAMVKKLYYEVAALLSWML